jgi:4-hydroxy-tetrahydrodipicolinate synthase
MAKMRVEDTFVALITPFNAGGTVDFGAFRSLLDWQAANGTSAVLIMGSTGEVSLLSAEERRAIVKKTIRFRDGRMKLFYGCTDNTTKTTIAYLRHAKANGADGAILAAPAYICATEADIERSSPKWPMQSICRSASTTTRRG